MAITQRSTVRPGLFAGLPDPRLLDQTVRDQLASSLAHIKSVVAPHSSVTDNALNSAIQHITCHKQHPGVIPRYFDLIAAVQDQDVARAEVLSKEIAELSREPLPFRILRFSEDALGDDFERLPRLVFAETGGRNVTTPESASFETAAQHVHAALKIIAETDPRITAEFDALCSQLILAAGRREDGKPSFGGVTSLLAWGTMVLNIDMQSDVNAMVLAITHEITHATLLGLSAIDPLVRNPPEQNYTSPLRDDARPMDGLFHATIVCGRLAYFNTLWSEAPTATEDARTWRRASGLRSRERFYKGKQTVDASGDLSPVARAILDECDAVLRDLT